MHEVDRIEALRVEIARELEKAQPDTAIVPTMV